MGANSSDGKINVHFWDLKSPAFRRPLPVRQAENQKGEPERGEPERGESQKGDIAKGQKGDIAKY
jgi:hypothetical protein